MPRRRRHHCVYTGQVGPFGPFAMDDCSKDLIEVWHGRPRPTYICGYHEELLSVPRAARPTMHVVWRDVDDLQVGDLVVTADSANTRRILRFEPRFNPRFRPVVMHDDPHAAADFDRHTSVLVAVQAGWMVGSDGSIDRVMPALPLLAERELPEEALCA